jgi:hypothetical protein
MNEPQPPPKTISGLYEGVLVLFGPIVFIVLVVGIGAIGVFQQWLSFADYLGAVGAGAGLLTIGHGIHRVARGRG